jgi:hypothetical protein
MAVAQKMFLLDIPQDILIRLPDFLHDIEDYKNLTSTCRALRVCLSTTTPNTILRLAAAASKVFFRPSPDFLVAGVARQLGEWARLSASNEHILAQTFQGGIEAVFELCLQHCGLTMEKIRRLHELRFSVINPVTDRIDKCIGEQWYATPNFWNGGVDDAYTISADPPEILFNIAIYGELFAPDFDILLDPGSSGKRALSVATRLEYVKYCIPDWAAYKCQRSARDATRPDGSMDPRRLVHATGPYVGFDNATTISTNGNQIGLRHLLNSSRWEPHWAAVRQTVGPDFAPEESSDAAYEGSEPEEHWKQLIWDELFVNQGLEGLGMMVEKDAGAYKDRLTGLHARISALETQLEETVVGRNTTYSWPCLRGDLDICCSGYIMGT